VPGKDTRYGCESGGIRRTPNAARRNGACTEPGEAFGVRGIPALSFCPALLIAPPNRAKRRNPPHCYEVCQVRRARFPFFSLKASVRVSFLSAPGLETFSWRRNGRSGCSSCYPCMAPQGQHQLTHTVTARKRTRPISKAGCCQPKCGCGRVPFQILRSELHGVFVAEVRSSPVVLSWRPDHDPTQVGGFGPAGAPAPQVHR